MSIVLKFFNAAIIGYSTVAFKLIRLKEFCIA